MACCLAINGQVKQWPDPRYRSGGDTSAVDHLTAVCLSTLVELQTNEGSRRFHNHEDRPN